MIHESIKCKAADVTVQPNQDMTSSTNYYGRRVFLQVTDDAGTTWNWGTATGRMPPVGAYVQASSAGRRATIDFT